MPYNHTPPTQQLITPLLPISENPETNKVPTKHTSELTDAFSPGFWTLIQTCILGVFSTVLCFYFTIGLAWHVFRCFCYEIKGWGRLGKRWLFWAFPRMAGNKSRSVGETKGNLLKIKEGSKEEEGKKGDLLKMEEESKEEEGKKEDLLKMKEESKEIEGKKEERKVVVVEIDDEWVRKEQKERDGEKSCWKWSKHTWNLAKVTEVFEEGWEDEWVVSRKRGL